MNNESKTRLLQAIEEKREEINSLIDDLIKKGQSLTAQEIIRACQDLDLLIVEYQKTMKKKKVKMLDRFQNSKILIFL